MTIAIPVSPSTAGSVTSYDSLLSAIDDDMNREFGERAARFVQFAESLINARLAVKPVRPMLSYSTLTIDDEYVTAPTDLLKPTSIQLSDGTQLTYVDPTNLAGLESDNVAAVEAWLAGTISPNPSSLRFYTLIDGDFRFYPIPETTEIATLTYWAKLPAINSTNATNWLLTDHPRVYLSACCYFAARHVRDDDDADRFSAEFDTLMEGVLTAYPTRSVAAPLRADTPISNRSVLY